MVALRTLALAGVTAAAFMPSAANAQIANAVPVNVRSTTVNGSIPNVCVLKQPKLGAGASVNFLGLNGTTLRVDALVDPQTLATRASSANLTFEGVCNFPHSLRIEAQNNGLFRTAAGIAAPAGFASAIPYSATVSWNSQNVVLNADANVRRFHEALIRVAEPAAGEINLRLEIQPGASNTQSNAPVLAGNYSDIVRITLEPQR